MIVTIRDTNYEKKFDLTRKDGSDFEPAMYERDWAEACADIRKRFHDWGVDDAITFMDGRGWNFTYVPENKS